jgi:hypothetical protein
MTTSAGLGNGTTLTDTELANLTEDDDGIQGWIKITSGNNSGEIRRIKSSGGYTASSTLITVNFRFTNQVASDVTYEVHNIDPTDKRNAINQAIASLFPSLNGRRGLYLRVRDEGLAVDNQLTNGSFESTISGGAHPSWTNVGSPTVDTETGITMHGAQSARVAASGADGQLTQSVNINVKELTGQTVTFKAWVFCETADAARIRIDWTGSAFENSDYHSGAAQWEQLSASADVPSSATRVQAICEVADGSTAYFDLARLDAGQVWKYTLPTTIRRLHWVAMQYSEDDPGGPYYPISPERPPITGRALRLEGVDLLSRPTTDSGTIEVDGEHVELIVARAAMYLDNMLRSRGVTDGLGEVNRLDQIALLLDRTAMPSLAAERPMGAWHIEEDSSGRYLILDVPRSTAFSF